MPPNALALAPQFETFQGFVCATPNAPKASPEERLAQLMAAERAETARRKKKMRRYGMIISAGILAAFALWLMRVFSRRR